MGSGTFFSKVASVDPLAQALHLPGSNKYAQNEASAANEASAGATTPYGGVTPTLAAANAGYAPGGPGSNSGYVPFVPRAPGGIFGTAQRFSSTVGDTTPNPIGGQMTPSNPGQIANTYSTGAPTGSANPYVAAAQGSPAMQAGMNPQASVNTLFGGGYRPTMRTVNGY